MVVMTPTGLWNARQTLDAAGRSTRPSTRMLSRAASAAGPQLPNPLPVHRDTAFENPLFRLAPGSQSRVRDDPLNPFHWHLRLPVGRV